MSVQETMKEIIRNHELMSFATIDENGIPTVRGIDYTVGDADNVLYFMSRKASRKISHIRNNPAVGFAIVRECPNPQELARAKFLKGTGEAFVIDDMEEAKKASVLVLKRYPFMVNLPGYPSEFVCVRLEMKNVLVSDHTVGVGHIEEVNF